MALLASSKGRSFNTSESGLISDNFMISNYRTWRGNII